MIGVLQAHCRHGAVAEPRSLHEGITVLCLGQPTDLQKLMTPPLGVRQAGLGQVVAGSGKCAPCSFKVFKFGFFTFLVVFF